MPLSTFSTGTGVESKAESAYIDVASRTKATLNSDREFLPPSKTLYIFVASMLGSLVIFWVPLNRLVEFAWNSEFSYIPLMPAISAFLIIMRRRAIFRQSKLHPTGGAIVLVCGVLLFSLTKFFPAATTPNHLWLPALGIVAAWWGLFVFCFGLRSARVAMLPLGLLFFMIPVPPVTNAVIRLLQHASAALSYSLFRMIGIPAMREGMTISLPGLNIQVAPECSGIRSSLSLLILTLAAANLYLRSGWNKIILVCLLLPLSILRNAIRIVTLTALALYVDESFLFGSLHHKGGILFFFLATMILMAVFSLMQRSERRNLNSTQLSSSAKTCKDSEGTGNSAVSITSGQPI
jgi:exosortase